ncbi:unnamed protein product, partial [Symbiodinium sp. KB8]
MLKPLIIAWVGHVKFNTVPHLEKDMSDKDLKKEAKQFKKLLNLHYDAASRVETDHRNSALSMLTATFVEQARLQKDNKHALRFEKVTYRKKRTAEEILEDDEGTQS